MEMHTDPRGEAYRQVIDLGIQNAEWFVLGEKFSTEPGVDTSARERYAPVLNHLKPYLVKTIVIQDKDTKEIMKELGELKNTYDSHAFYGSGTYYFYRCCEESGNVLKQAANRLADWMYPKLPEDLCFLKKEGGDYLYSVVHERIYGMEVTEEEAAGLMEQVTGLFMELAAHRELDCLLDDAIRHRTDKLYISGYRLTELPERIRELGGLRELEIFEQDLYRLPDGLFELEKLERLIIMTADLQQIPGSINRLKNLKELTIQCASSDRPVPGYQAKPKEEISLNRIPPEIGELEQLERLTIQYTAIRELPVELTKLKKLQVLDLGMCMIPEKPGFLREMQQLKYINLSQDSLW
ncbi:MULTISPECIES: leucine-rich repeat domain-containing protein [unclassified Paenibacillus]|uniref:leucine-rich repeat domain-containing protein n=1 Tax=unclassified Paenibacillus TaxID=185978 RepID=UPI002406AEFB|nr:MULTISPECIES: leucine-rich repeat domain-containing protein [unclassified Paenibacillus]MDF9843596.1 Leucine-rich repeat (LRR) protein [Paenibacillus sp. PastF-2]MDF9850185.1 Leucine-rich repeat (LRR) protein [Paenibacillus sp. PastM-2]MDF9856875.1 Leucine-rich repeat (LRR) protein [Paenibacillus sp. PastF-1]MDH6482032.1 Leucine-rich repeat (LRR) protein [Paenibacillus sp. PastH-2]MDH6509456.1 Leucine-rich repeat (LRR) protein [Paenibacillus sp. PastM-3]